jgi:phenylalanyl-tRNA synthetase beta chain
MKISFDQLKQYIPFELTPQQLAFQLTESGLEVESIINYESIPGSLNGVVVGQVLTCMQHPNADKLKLTTVSVGSSAPLQIVCGAPNVAEGQKVFVATVGTKLQPSQGEAITIQKSKIRGQVSEGMLCAADELGIGTSHDGIEVLNTDAIIGMPAAEYLQIQTATVFEIGLTPNRADAASHIGVARDIQALLSLDDAPVLTYPQVDAFKTQNNAPIVSITIDKQACLRYSAVEIEGVTVAPSPDWMQFFLKSIGVKPINNIVDATNFVLHEIGQPLHAFDLEKITTQKVEVKKLPAGTAFVSLDGVSRTLQGNELMICNGNEPMCMAGIFGGLQSGINSQTTKVFLESACFNAVDIRKASKLHNLKTDASFRFERGTDPNITVYALKRAATLITQIAGGTISSVTDLYPNPVMGFDVTLRYQKLFAMMGKPIDTLSVKKIITALGIEIINEDAEALKLLVPAFKVDVQREIDVIEEVMRIYGFNKIALPTHLRTAAVSSKGQQRFTYKTRIGQYLIAQGFNEIWSNSLTKQAYAEMYDAKPTPVVLLNPLSSDLNSLRTGLLFSALEVAQYNNNRKNADLKLFEMGNGYVLADGFKETNYLSITLAGQRQADSRFKTAAIDIFYLKALVHNVFNNVHVLFKETVMDATANYLQLIQVIVDKKTVGHYGQLQKSILKKFDLDGPVYYAEINLDMLTQVADNATVAITEVPKYPEVKRDLSMLLDKNVPYSQLEKLAFETERNLLKKVNLFDVYEGKNIPADKKSYALTFTLYNAEKTLQDADIEKVIKKLMEAFEQKLNAEIRK